MYWALTHKEDLREKFQLATKTGAKKLKEAGGKLLFMLGFARFKAVSEHATDKCSVQLSRGVILSVGLVPNRQQLTRKLFI